MAPIIRELEEVVDHIVGRGSIYYWVIIYKPHTTKVGGQSVYDNRLHCDTQHVKTVDQNLKL